MSMCCVNDCECACVQVVMRKELMETKMSDATTGRGMTRTSKNNNSTAYYLTEE